MHSSFYLRFSCACSLIYLQQSWKKERTCFSWVHTSSLCLGVCVLFSSFFFSTGSICLPHWSQCLHSPLWLIRTSLRHGVGGHLLSYLKVNHILPLVSVISRLKIPMESLSPFTVIFHRSTLLCLF